MMNTAKILPIDKEIIPETPQKEGHISLFRSIRKHWIWEDAEKLKWWIDILLEANHKDKKVLIKGELIVCKRGECLVSLETWSKRWRVERSRVRRFLDLLESDTMIARKSTHKTTHLTICNYESYQGYRHANATANAQQTARQTPTTNNDNNDNNEISSVVQHKKTKREKKVFIKPEETELINHFVEKGVDEFTAMAEAKKFLEYYEDNDWRCGRDQKPMMNWKASATGWKNRMQQFSNNNYGNKGNFTSGGSKPGTSQARIDALKNW